MAHGFWTPKTKEKYSPVFQATLWYLGMPLLAWTFIYWLVLFFWMDSQSFPLQGWSFLFFHSHLTSFICLLLLGWLMTGLVSLGLSFPGVLVKGISWFSTGHGGVHRKKALRRFWRFFCLDLAPFVTLIAFHLCYFLWILALLGPAFPASSTGVWNSVRSFGITLGSKWDLYQFQIQALPSIKADSFLMIHVPDHTLRQFAKHPDSSLCGFESPPTPIWRDLLSSPHEWSRISLESSEELASPAPHSASLVPLDYLASHLALGYAPYLHFGTQFSRYDLFLLRFTRSLLPLYPLFQGGYLGNLHPSLEWHNIQANDLELFKQFVEFGNSGMNEASQDAPPKVAHLYLLESALYAAGSLLPGRWVYRTPQDLEFESQVMEKAVQSLIQVCRYFKEKNFKRFAFVSTFQDHEEDHQGIVFSREPLSARTLSEVLQPRGPSEAMVLSQGLTCVPLELSYFKKLNERKQFQELEHNLLRKMLYWDQNDFLQFSKSYQFLNGNTDHFGYLCLPKQGTNLPEFFVSMSNALDSSHRNSVLWEHQGSQLVRFEEELEMEKRLDQFVKKALQTKEPKSPSAQLDKAKDKRKKTSEKGLFVSLVLKEKDRLILKNLEAAAAPFSDDDWESLQKGLEKLAFDEVRIQ